VVTLNSDREPERFSVYWFDKDGYSTHEGEDLDAEHAVLLAKHLSDSVGGRNGMVARIIITDNMDCTCFEWRHGKGVTFK
jgi:hypothetical protein